MDLARLPEPADPVARHGTVSKAPTGLGAPFEVTVPGFDDLHVYEIRRWEARGTTVPAVGDEALIVIDDESEPWAAAWWPAEGDEPLGSEATRDWKDSVRAATTANITIATALNNGDSLDGVTLATGDRVLVKDQTTKSENGIWVVGVSPARATDADEAGDISGGSTVYVEEGTRNKRRYFKILTAGSITPGTTAHEWEQSYPKNWGLRESLPTSEAVKGDLCYYIADNTNGIIWALIYDGEGEYPWKAIGAPTPLVARSDTGRATNETTYKSLPTDPLSITVPLKGDYDITIEGAIYNVAANRAGFLSYEVGSTAATDNWAATFFSSGTGTASGSLTTRHTAIAASAVITEKAKRETGEVQFFRRRLRVVPVRVG